MSTVKSLVKRMLQAEPAAPTATTSVTERSGGHPRWPDADHWLDVARSIGSIAAAHADESERLRRLADPVAEALISTDLARLMVPTVYGGHQADLVTAVEVVEELSRVDGSLGWNAWVTIGHGRTADSLPESAAREVFGKGNVLAGSLRPTGTAERVAGGYRVTGRWPFASACHLANWRIGAANLPSSGVERIRQGQGPEITMAFVMPAEDCTTLDTWHTTGLCATGSHDFETTDTFVPDAFAIPARRIFSVLPEGPNIGYGRPYGEYSPPMMAAVGLGVARHAIELTRVELRRQAETNGARLDKVRSSHTERLGRAEATLRSARAWLYEVVRGLATLRPGDPDHSLESRLASAHAAEACVRATESLYHAGGSAAIYSRTGMDRCFRDVQMVPQHALINFSTFTDFGEEQLRRETV